MKAIVLIFYSVLIFSLSSAGNTEKPDTVSGSNSNTEATVSSDPMIGEVILFAGSFAPRGWEFCDGKLLAISQNTALFSILGTQYGGDGRTTFALPDLEDNSSVRYIIAVRGVYPSRN